MLCITLAEYARTQSKLILKVTDSGATERSVAPLSPVYSLLLCRAPFSSCSMLGTHFTSHSLRASVLNIAVTHTHTHIHTHTHTHTHSYSLWCMNSSDRDELRQVSIITSLPVLQPGGRGGTGDCWLAVVTNLWWRMLLMSAFPPVALGSCFAKCCVEHCWGLNIWSQRIWVYANSSSLASFLEATVHKRQLALTAEALAVLTVYHQTRGFLFKNFRGWQNKRNT